MWIRYITIKLLGTCLLPFALIHLAYLDVFGFLKNQCEKDGI